MPTDTLNGLLNDLFRETYGVVQGGASLTAEMLQRAAQAAATRGNNREYGQYHVPIEYARQAQPIPVSIPMEYGAAQNQGLTQAAATSGAALRQASLAQTQARAYSELASLAERQTMYPYASTKTELSEEHKILTHFIKINKYNYSPADLFLSFEKLDGKYWEHEYEGIMHYIYLEEPHEECSR